MGFIFKLAGSGLSHLPYTVVLKINYDVIETSKLQNNVGSIQNMVDK